MEFYDIYNNKPMNIFLYDFCHWYCYLENLFYRRNSAHIYLLDSQIVYCFEFFSPLHLERTVSLKVFCDKINVIIIRQL